MADKSLDTWNTPLKDSGSRKSYETGAVRDNSTGKGRFDLLPIDALFQVAKHFEKGAIKYEARNWEKGINVSRYVDSSLRHLLQFARGDKDEPHLIAAAWNVLALIQTLQWIDEGILPSSLNDLPVRNPIQAEPSAEKITDAAYSPVPEGTELKRYCFRQSYVTNPGLDYVEFLVSPIDTIRSTFVYKDGMLRPNTSNYIEAYIYSDEWYNDVEFAATT